MPPGTFKTGLIGLPPSPDGYFCFFLRSACSMCSISKAPPSRMARAARMAAPASPMRIMKPTSPACPLAYSRAAKSQVPARIRGRPTISIRPASRLGPHFPRGGRAWVGLLLYVFFLFMTVLSSMCCVFPAGRAGYSVFHALLYTSGRKNQ